MPFISNSQKTRVLAGGCPVGRSFKGLQLEDIGKPAAVETLDGSGCEWLPVGV